MKRILIIALAALLVAGPVNAYENVNLAKGLGSVLASEALCGLTYDQAAIEAFIEKNVPAGDTQFPDLLVTETWAAGQDNQGMSESAVTAHCAQIVRIAEGYGFFGQWGPYWSGK
jgi:hypothetical protein